MVSFKSWIRELADEELDNLLDMWDSENSTIIIKASRIFKKYAVKKELDYDECMSFSSRRSMCNKVHDIASLWINETFFNKRRTGVSLTTLTKLTKL